MKIKEIIFEAIPQFSEFDKAYVGEHQTFEQFYKRPPQPQAFKAQIEEKRKHYQFDRELLSQIIDSQYDKVGLLNDNLKARTNQLRAKNTFTITTAHQPSLFTGPLYFIYKIISTIKTAEFLDDKIKETTVLPLFIIGGEDHDFEEINHIQYRDQLFKWNEEEHGAVGRMSTKGIIEVIDQLEPHLQKSFYGKEMLEILKAAYDGHKTLSQATQYFVAKLFEDSPLIVLSMDDAKLKNAFVPYIKKEVIEQVSHRHVTATQEQLNELGYKAQAHAREINFFYLQPNHRSRIVKDKDRFIVLDTELSFTENEMEEEIKNHPERFSPNVVMRPVYQEFVLPNLAYIGGGGELAYWMERKSQFEQFNIPFPILMRRHSATLLSASAHKKVESFSWQIEEWFNEKHQLIDKFLSEHHKETLDFSASYAKMHELFDEIRPTLVGVDETLDYSVEAARSDALNIVERLRTKMKRALKQKEDQQLQRIDDVRAILLPSGNLQERTHNFIQYYEMWGPDLFDRIAEAFKPFDIKMKLLTDL